MLSEPPDQAILAEAIAEAVIKKLKLPDQRFFTVAGAAVYTGLSEDSVRAMLSAGKLTGHRPVRAEC